MSVEIHDFTLPVFQRRLEALRAVIAKAQAHAEARKFDSAKYLDCKLAPDMLGFASQIRIACDLAKNGAGRLAEVERPSFGEDEKTLDDLVGRIDKTLAFLASIPAEKLAGSESRAITFPTGGQELTLSGLDYARHFVVPNFDFHATAAYLILRHAGVELGKKDYLGAV